MQQVTIIGAGVIGLTTAVFLQQAGFQTLLLDQAGPGSGCSRGNAGHFATEQVFPLAQPSLLKQLPAMLLDPVGPLKLRANYLLQSLPWFGRFLANMSKDKRLAHQQALSQLNHQSIRSWQTLLELCQLSDQIQYQGALLVTEQHNSKELQSCYQSFRQAGIDVSWRDKAALQQLEPELSGSLTAALDFTEVAHSPDPYLLCQLLFDKFCQLGGQWQQSAVQHISVRPQGIQIQTGQQQIVSKQLVIAAGAHSGHFTKQLGWIVPLTAERGYHLMVQPIALKRPVSSLERKFIMTPMQQGLRLAGTVEFAGLNSDPDYRRALILKQHAEALLNQPLQASNTALPWAGNRPSLPDSLPVLGPCPVHKGVFYNFGHQHLGLTQAAFSAELLTSLFRALQPAISLTPYRINRF
ncbi:glycine/D-amino acid oxidase, deaminating [Rheinheimera sp. A13L]|uniref:NAD(P)/FAD-dependent oxidoreductase n=1 Tax=Rheinheimera sp. A13L TaxID=506534 RepID=UPI00021251B0|nr:FAD-dependent oxidoreductase [Rheinheimera sp. A13L]EGM79081.1 glycine/D-amino acid oxidase, deaminating [Rheinheimera sp. A13L]